MSRTSAFEQATKVVKAIIDHGAIAVLKSPMGFVLRKVHQTPASMTRVVGIYDGSATFRSIEEDLEWAMVHMQVTGHDKTPATPERKDCRCRATSKSAAEV